ncbi:MAG: hypothetical protein N2747_06155 [Chitinophagaceae bacterium]|nr:hypothetical protein [Chitinophagaceae bacterium]
MAKLQGYCDSLYQRKIQINTAPINYKLEYPQIVSEVVRKRFYHGYSHYGWGDNFVARLGALLTNPGYSAIVIPDDIMKHPNAACSQQAIVIMELLRRKGYFVRKVGFKGKIFNRGHYCLEVFYNGSWHLIDSNMEPDLSVLATYQFPSMSYLASHPEILLQAYSHVPKEEVLDLFLSYSYGKINENPAPRATIYHQITRFLSYTLWIFLLALLFIVRKKYKRLTQPAYVRHCRVSVVPAE